MQNQFSRTELLIGKESIDKLNRSRVAVFGIGGVGGYVVEALIRSGLGNIDIIDNDEVCLTNLNRQIIATHSTIGKPKVDVMEERIKDINPDVKVVKHKVFYAPKATKVDNNMSSYNHICLSPHDKFDFTQYDYVVDAIDTVSGKLEIIEQSKKANVPVISCMGAGNKMHPEMFEVADISKTSVCPLAKVIRQELKKRRINKVKVVYSKEKPIKINSRTPGSTSLVPSAAGILCASFIINDILEGVWQN